MAQNAALRSTSDAILDTIIRNMMSKNLYILLFKVAEVTVHWSAKLLIS